MTTTWDVEYERMIDHVVRRVAARFGDRLDAELVVKIVQRTAVRFESARIRDFVPVLVEREAVEELRTLE